MCNRGKVGTGWPVCSHSMDKKALIYAAPLYQVFTEVLSWLPSTVSAKHLQVSIILGSQGHRWLLNASSIPQWAKIKCSVQGEPPARFHFNIGISQANYNSGSQEVPGEGICQPRCIGHWLWSSCKAHLTTWVRPRKAIMLKVRFKILPQCPKTSCSMPRQEQVPVTPYLQNAMSLYLRSSPVVGNVKLH